MMDSNVQGKREFPDSRPTKGENAMEKKELKGYLILETGEVFEGIAFGAINAHDTAIDGMGEVVFNTSMTGYQEILTDPSYEGQIVTLTYPLIGNYGVNPAVNQSRGIFAKGLIIREEAPVYSHWNSNQSLHDFLCENNTMGLMGVDTRMLTKKIRENGTLRGVLVGNTANKDAIVERLKMFQNTGCVKRATTTSVYTLGDGNGGKKVAVLDCGIKQNILDSLLARGFQLTVYPAFTSAEVILADRPDGVFLSNGPGDPEELTEVIETVKNLIGKVPVFGICLGHQLIALALGASTEKLKFGHRGGNHPVKDLSENRVVITSQNHGYVVVDSTLQGKNVEITHRSLNDDSIEGIRHNSFPLFSVQYHPEAAPGPGDSEYLFDRFDALMSK